MMTQVQRTRCVSRPKLRGLGIGSSALNYGKRSLRSGDGLIQRSFPDGNGMISGHFRLGCSDQRRIRAHIILIRDDFEGNWV